MIPDWKLERFLTGDLPVKEMEEIQTLEKKDTFLKRRIQELRENNKVILEELPFENLVEKLPKTKKQWNFNFGKLAIAAVFILALTLSCVLVNFILKTPANENVMEKMQVAVHTETRVKGFDARIEIWKKTETGIAQLENFDEVKAGDEIQVRYSVPEKCFGILFSMDGNGNLTQHMGNAEKAIALLPGKMNSLPFAYKLDNAPHFEKFFFVTSKNEFSVEKNSIDELMKNTNLHIVEFTLRKGGK